MRRLIACILSACLIAACEPASPLGESGDGPALITVFGEVGAVDRGPSDPQTEPLFTLYGMEFSVAATLTWDRLAALEQHTVSVDYPAGGALRSFSGPLLRDALALAQPGEGDLAITALDGYRREFPQLIFDVHDVILAIRLNEEPLPVGGFGPAMLVWPRRDDPALVGMPDDNWVWGVFAIEVGPVAP